VQQGEEGREVTGVISAPPGCEEGELAAFAPIRGGQAAIINSAPPLATFVELFYALARRSVNRPPSVHILYCLYEGSSIGLERHVNKRGTS
jgi:hypothetical protein